MSKESSFLNTRFLIGLGIVLLFILVTAYFFYGLQPSAVETGGESGTTEVPAKKLKIIRGDGLKEIGAQLSRMSLIKSIAVFKLYSLFSGSAQQFQPGVYELNGTMSVPQIVNILTTGGAHEVAVTLPEGLTVKDVDRILTTEGVIEAGTLVNFSIQNLIERYPFLREKNSLEGFLFPDTYRFEVDSGAEKLVERMLDNFNEKVWEQLSKEENWYDILILASLLEREVPEFSDRQIVAGILLKRVRIGMLLQVDATVSYVKCGGVLYTCENPRIERSDLSLPSPYNTYEHLGFPPAPIANPGEAAVSAALNPQESPYLYYLSASESGETIFSRTLEEHNVNRAKYL